ncbi:leucyl/phenylalanyl-tRNA--protein transferase [Treponema sp. OMZ 840]|uniref:leucyl/phenylalanyl-tRNA--protein transferase n=1 Tax=Treponema sp. OMZ 840 TaxID=244313 RepID=UPI003D9031FA
MSGQSPSNTGEPRHFQAFAALPDAQWYQFSSPEDTGLDIVGIGGDLSPSMLLSAYLQGVFPWYNSGEPVLWWSPDPRFILLPEELHVPSRLARTMKKNAANFTYTMNTKFKEVITACAEAKRADQDGTWISPDMINAYTALHRLGRAHSFETYQNGILCGGFYGVLIGQVFFGESMFSLVPDASKCAFVHFVQNFKRCGGKLVDSQVYTNHIARFGGKNISRTAFLRLEALYLNAPLEIELEKVYGA